MSVHVNYMGGFGNNICQYVCGRLFARSQGLKLMTPFPHSAMLATTPHEDLEIVQEPIIKLTDGDTDIYRARAKGRYVLNGFFQKSLWYSARRDEILGFMRPVKAVTEKNTKDIVAHFRLGDYPMKWRVHPSWFLDILSTERFERLYIVTNERNERYLSHFATFNPVIVRGSASEDWNVIRTFDRILAPNSTYSWWASFFSSASRIYTHKKWLNGHVRFADLSAIGNGIQSDGPYCDEKNW